MSRPRSKVDVVHERLAAHIRLLMRVRGLSMNWLADFSGLGRGYVSDVLGGRKSPTVRTLVRIAEGLDVRVQDLFDWPATTAPTSTGVERPASKSKAATRRRSP